MGLIERVTGCGCVCFGSKELVKGAEGMEIK